MVWQLTVSLHSDDPNPYKVTNPRTGVFTFSLTPTPTQNCSECVGQSKKTPMGGMRVTCICINHCSVMDMTSLYKKKWPVTESPSLAMVHKLKFEHIHLTSFSKMRVDLAAQASHTFVYILYSDILYMCMCRF